MKLDYDRSADVLYVTFDASSQRSLYLENGMGQILRVDPETMKIVGCTIPMFSRRIKEGELEVPEIGGVSSTPALSAILTEPTR